MKHKAENENAEGEKALMIRRLGAVLLAGLLTAGLVVGCAKKEETVQGEKEQLVIWHYLSQGYNSRALGNMAEEFNQSQDKIKVTTQYVPDEDFRKKLALSMADGVMPELVLMDSADFQFFNDIQPFVDLTDKIEEREEYLPQAMAACTVDDRIMGLPFGLNCIALYYNEDIFSVHNAEVPQTWADFYDTAVKLSDELHYGFAMPAVQGEESAYNFLPVLWAAGGTVDTVNSEDSKKAFHLLRQLTEGGAMSKQAINLNGADLVSQFSEGKIAMMFNATTMIDSIREQNPDLDFGVTFLPQSQSGEQISIMGGEVFGVKRGPHQQAAVEFLQFISDRERMEGYLEQSGYLSPRQDILEEQYTNDPLKMQAKEILKVARTREFTKEWPCVSENIVKAMGDEIIDQRDENELLNETADNIKEIREGKQ